MSRADSGGFDLVIEISLAALRRELTAALAAPLPEATFAVPSWGTLRLGSSVVLSDLTLLPDATVRTGLGASLTLSWPRWVWNGIEVARAGSATIGATVTFDAGPRVGGRALSIVCPPGTASVALLPGTLEAIPAVGAYLATVGRWQGAAAREAARAQLYADTQSGLSRTLDALLPDRLPLGQLPPGVGSAEFVAAGQELRLLAMIGGSRAAASPAAITRSAIRGGPPGAAPLDLVGVVVGNHCLQRDLMRPVLTAGLGLAPGGFNPTHPCRWGGRAALPITVEGITPVVTLVSTGIDAFGLMRITVAFEGTHGSTAFGFTGQVTVSVGASVTTNPDGSRTVTLSTSSSVVDALDIWIAGWVYVAGIFISPTLVLIAALTDAFAGGGLAAAINGAIAGAIGPGSLTLTLPQTAFGLRTLGMAQFDAEPQFFTVGGLTLPALPANDLILSFG